MNKTLLIIGVLIVGVVAIYFVWQGKFEQSEKTNVYKYELRHNESGDFGSHEFHDAKLIQINEAAGEEIVLVQSIKSAMPSLKEQFNRTLFKLSFPENSQRLYFIEVLNNTDAPPAALYAFNLTNNTFSKLQSSTYLMAHGPFVVSPDGFMAVTTIDPSGDEAIQKLFLINFEEDAVRVLAVLSGNETFSYCTLDCFTLNAGEIKWIDNRTIEYGVYDRLKTTQSDFGAMVHPLIEKRIITFN